MVVLVVNDKNISSHQDGTKPRFSSGAGAGVCAYLQRQSHHTCVLTAIGARRSVEKLDTADCSKIDEIGKPSLVLWLAW